MTGGVLITSQALAQYRALGQFQCGKVQVPVRAVENSEEGPQPPAERIHELRATNTATLASLAVAGNACPKPAFSAEA